MTNHLQLPPLQRQLLLIGICFLAAKPQRWGFYHIPLGAAALQFPAGHPSVVSVIPGMNSPEIVSTNLDWFQLDIPDDLWSELKAEGLLRADVPTPKAG
ncbi:MAG: hypothetical protein O3C43_17665 [Verrucomicrobia bacterium]|nr:hypothetical protein [Verrucomicrobiota bacterium]MDA1068319.1 hypothetical protein [Verrucomicrobiota bacterium]